MLSWQLARGVDELQGCCVFVVGICREPALVHSALRCNDRLTRALTIGVPPPDERADILETLATKLLPAARPDGKMTCRSIYLNTLVRGFCLYPTEVKFILHCRS